MAVRRAPHKQPGWIELPAWMLPALLFVALLVYLCWAWWIV